MKMEGDEKLPGAGGAQGDGDVLDGCCWWSCKSVIILKAPELYTFHG